MRAHQITISLCVVNIKRCGVLDKGVIHLHVYDRQYEIYFKGNNDEIRTLLS